MTKFLVPTLVVVVAEVVVGVPGVVLDVVLVVVVAGVLVEVLDVVVVGVP